MAKADRKLAVLADRIAVELEKETHSRGGIVLPESAQKRTSIGRAIEVGPGQFCPELGKCIPCEVQVGQRLLIETYSGIETELDDGTKLTVVRERDVVAILPPKQG